MPILLLSFTALAVEAPIAAHLSSGAQSTCTQQTLGPAVVDIPSVSVRPRFRLNGRTFPGPEAGTAIFTLWASTPDALFDGPQLILGETHLPGQTVRVVPGVYDVYYSWVTGTRVPRNQHTRVLQGVTIDRNRELTVDVSMIRLTGLKHHNGSPFGYDGAATLRLRGVDWPGEVELGAAQPAEFHAAIIPGRYAFEYDWQQGVPFPNNRHAIVGELSLLTDVTRLVLNVPSVIQSFQFLHNGSPFPPALFDRGDLVLKRGAREELIVGSSHEQAAVVRMLPGTYDVHWRHVAGANVPNNQDARIRRGLITNGGLRTLDVRSIEVSGSIRVNGAAPPPSDIENARLSLVNGATGDTVVLGQTKWGAYQQRVVPGTYNIVYEHLAGASVMPANLRATLVKGWQVQTNPTRLIDIPVGTYKGAFLWNGDAFGGGEVEHGDIYVVREPPGDEPVVLGRTHYGGFERRLLPGFYRPAYAHAVGANVPQNRFTTFGPKRRVWKDTDTVGDIDVRSGPLEVSYRHNGAAFGLGDPQNARVHLARGANYLRLDDSADGVRELEAMEGEFDLYYQYRSGPDLPRNAFMPFACWNLVR